MKVTVQDSKEFLNNESAQKLYRELMSHYESSAFSAGLTEHEKRLEAIVAQRVLKDYYEKLMLPAQRNQL